MLPVKKESSALTPAQERYLDQRKELIEQPAVQAKLSITEMQIVTASVEMPIKTMPEDKLISQVSTATKFIQRDLGIKTWDNNEILKYDAVRFFTTLRTYYGDLSLKEVKMAFELAAVGELDEWLPKDKNGDPDHHHYQSFNVNYYSKILKAYRAKKGRTWHKARKALPAPEVVITQEEREANRKACLEDINRAFDTYQKTGSGPRFEISIFLEILIELGAIDKKPEPNNREKELAYKRLLDQDPTPSLKRELIDTWHAGKRNDLIEAEAQRIANNRAIKALFDNLIQENQDIRELTKNESK